MTGNVLKTANDFVATTAGGLGTCTSVQYYHPSVELQRTANRWGNMLNFPGHQCEGKNCRQFRLTIFNKNLVDQIDSHMIQILCCWSWVQDFQDDFKKLKRSYFLCWITYVGTYLDNTDPRI